MLKVIVGLGNPCQQYTKTRHNAGFWFVDQLAEQYGGNWQIEKKFQARLANITSNQEKLILLKPETFMNLSGQSLQALCKYYNISVSDCLVVHDELDFLPGVIRLKLGGGHAGHNGLRSIIAHMGTADFPRLRFGVGRPAGSSVANFVLSEPSRLEFEQIERAIALAIVEIPSLISQDYNKVSQILNT